MECSRAKPMRRSSRGIISRAGAVSSAAPSATKAFCMSMTINAARRGSILKKSLPEALILADMPSLLFLPLRLFPDAALVHQRDLPIDHLLLILGVLHGRAVEVEGFGVDRLFVDNLVELSAQVFHPVVPLGARTVVAQRLDVNHPGDVARPSAVLQLPHFLSFVIENVGPAAEGIDRSRVFGEQEIRPQIGSDDIHVVVERPRRAL